MDANGSTTWTVPASLPEDTVCYWRVRSHDGLVSSEWVVSSFFVSVSNDAPSAPVPVSPSDEFLSTRTPTLTALASADPEGAAVTYEFEVMHKDGEVIAGTTGVSADGATVSWTVDPELKRGKTLTWHARGTDAGGAVGPWSALATFEVYEEPYDNHGSCSIGSVGGSRFSMAWVALSFCGILLARHILRRFA